MYVCVCDLRYDDLGLYICKFCVMVQRRKNKGAVNVSLRNSRGGQGCGHDCIFGSTWGSSGSIVPKKKASVRV